MGRRKRARDMQQIPRMDEETAGAFAANEFEMRHPRDTWPEWLKPCTAVGYSRDEQRRFIVSFAVSLQEPLPADEHWEERDGERRLVRVDPGTLERQVVYRTPRQTEVYFRAVVDPETANVTVLIDR